MTVDPRRLYLDLIKRSLLGLLDEDAPLATFPRFEGAIPDPIGFDRELRQRGEDWPSRALSMIGLERMNNLETCIEQVLADGVPGDLIETGVWRGGATIFMRAMLAAHGCADRSVWVADSFEGMPPPDIERYPADIGLDLTSHNDLLAVSADTVRASFERYGLLDERVRFVEGWFSDTLTEAPIEQLAILRLDGDLYESTIQALDALYPKLSPGGFLIVDDHFLPPCARAVREYREREGISEEILPIDNAGVYWRRGQDYPLTKGSGLPT